MRAILQRVSSAAVKVDGDAVGAIERGILLLVGVEKGDSAEDSDSLARKIVGLRMFADASGKTNLSVAEVGGEVLIVSQFTLAASLARGRRPSFHNAEAPDLARTLVEALMREITNLGVTVAGGRFGANMEVELVNDGPVTFCLECRGGKIV